MRNTQSKTTQKTQHTPQIVPPPAPPEAWALEEIETLQLKNSVTTMSMIELKRQNLEHQLNALSTQAQAEHGSWIERVAKRVGISREEMAQYEFDVSTGQAKRKADKAVA